MGILIILKDNVKDNLMISHDNKVEGKMTVVRVTFGRITFRVTEVGVMVMDLATVEVNGMIKILIDLLQRSYYQHQHLMTQTGN